MSGWRVSFLSFILFPLVSQIVDDRLDRLELIVDCVFAN